MAPSVNEALREFVRYEGDGLGGVGALPIGDPQSGVHHPTKKDIRETVGSVFGIRDELTDLRDEVLGIAQDVVTQGNVPVYSTVTAVQGLVIPPLMQVIRVTGRTVAGVGGHYYRRNPASTHPFRFSDAGGAVWEPTTDPALLSALSAAAGGIMVGVGTTGDYPDIPTAIESLRNYSIRGGQKIELRIVSPITRGHLSTQGVDDGKFLITNGMGGASVPLASGFIGVSDVGMGGNQRTDNLFAGFYATLPTLGCVIDMGNRGGSGYYGIQSCAGMVLQNCGVINAGYNGLEWRGAGGVAAYKTRWDGATCSGVRAAHAANVAAQESTADDCCKNPNEGPTVGAVDVSRTSTVHFRAGSASRSGGAGANARRSSIFNCEEATFDDSGSYGIISQHMAKISAWGVKIRNTRRASPDVLGYGVWLRDGEMTLQGATVTGSAGAADIRIGDSEPDQSGATLNASNCRTTYGLNSIRSYIGVTRFNLPGRYGVVWNAAMDSPLAMGVFSPTGASRGTDFDNDYGFLRTSTDTRTSSTMGAYYNPDGLVGRLMITSAGPSLVSTSDRRLKTDLGEIDFDPYEWALQLILRRYLMNGGGLPLYGVFAQELLNTDPEAVIPGVGEPGDDGFVPWGVDLTRLIPKQLLVIQKLVEHIVELDRRLSAFEGTS